MRHYKHLILSILSLLAVTVHLHAAEVGVVLVSDEVSVRELSKNELASIFLGKKTNWDDGTRINIAYMNDDSPKVEEFFEEYVGKSHRRFKKYWVKKVFAGYGIAPKLLRNVEKAVEFVNRYRGAIAFVTVPDETQLNGLQSVRVDGVSAF